MVCGTYCARLLLPPQFVVQFQQPHLRPVVAFKDRLHCGSHSTLSRSHQLHVCHIRTIHRLVIRAPATDQQRTKPNASGNHSSTQTRSALRSPPPRHRAASQPPSTTVTTLPTFLLAHPLYPPIRRDSEFYSSSVLYQTDNSATLYNALWHRRLQDGPAQACLAVSSSHTNMICPLLEGGLHKQECAANRTL